MTRAQVLEAGWDDDAVSYRLKVGRLYRVHPGVYAVGRPPVTPLERAMAAVLACGPRAVLSHGSALTLWGVWKRWETPFHVTVVGDRRPKGIRVHRVKQLDRRDLARHYGLPVTTLARALLDQAPHIARTTLIRAFNDARLNGRVHLASLEDLVKRHPYHHGRVKLEAVLGSATNRPTRSSLEDSFPALCELHDLPIPEMNATVCGFEVDALFAEAKLIVELDGWAFHSTRTAFERDRMRDAVTLAEGFRTVRVTAERYEQDPAAEAARLREILARRMAA